MQIVFRTTPEAKENVLRYFARFAETTVIPTHDEVHVTVHMDGPYREISDDARDVILTWPGVKAVKISLQNIG